MRRRTSWSFACGGIFLLACVETVAGRLDESRGATYDQVWAEYDRHYAFFASRMVDWAGVRARYRPQALGRDRALYTALCLTIDTLRDYHVVLFTEYGACGSPPLRHPDPYNWTAVESFLGATMRRTPSTMITYGMMAGDIGYIRISRFGGSGEEAEIDEILGSLAAARALIIDMRGNAGGFSATSESIAGRFADIERPYATVRFRDGPGHDDFSAPITWRVRPVGARHFAGPVAVIVDRSVGSAGEDFVMAMRVLPSVTLIGDTTLGNASNPLWRELPNGWSYWVPQSIETTIDGITPTADGGIPPAMYVPVSPAEEAAGADPALYRALSLLQR